LDSADPVACADAGEIQAEAAAIVTPVITAVHRSLRNIPKGYTAARGTTIRQRRF
jgi:hypothetical protein